MLAMRCISRSANHRGLTLAEAVVSSAIVGMTLVAALSTVGIAARAHRSIQASAIGPALAEHLIAEMLALPYDDPESPGALGREAGETTARSTWDDLDDYFDLAETTIGDRSGNSLSLTGYARYVSVNFVDPDNPLATVIDDRGLKLITVVVVSPDGRSHNTQTLVSRQRTVDQAHDAAADYWTAARIRLRTGAASLAIRSGTPLAQGLSP